MSTTHFVGKVAQKALLIKDGMVLITRDSGDEMWELPGGRLDTREEPREGMLREIREELGVEGKIEGIFRVRAMYHPRDKADILVVYYIVSLVDSNATFTVDPEEVADMAWVDGESYVAYSYFSEYKSILTDYFNSTSS